MTYCLGICVEQGLVLASDSRTSAGVDYASVYSKMHAFKPAADRQFVLIEGEQDSPSGGVGQRGESVVNQCGSSHIR